jgi:hypothetical protein
MSLASFDRCPVAALSSALLGTITLLTLTGCGGTPSSSLVSTPTPTPTATPAPAPTANLTATAAAAYLAAATTANVATDNPQHKATCNSATIANNKACYAQEFTLEEQFLTTISAITFPDSMKADVSALISANTKEAQLDNTLSQEANPNADTLDYNALKGVVNDASAASGVVRHDLGLPPVPPV